MDIVTIVMHTLLSGPIYTLFVYLYFQSEYSIYFGFAIGLISSFYIICKENTNHNIHPIISIYVAFPVILSFSPFLGWIFEFSFGSLGYFVGYVLGALFSWFFILYNLSEFSEYFEVP